MLKYSEYAKHSAVFVLAVQAAICLHRLMRIRAQCRNSDGFHAAPPVYWRFAASPVGMPQIERAALLRGTQGE